MCNVRNIYGTVAKIIKNSSNFKKYIVLNV